MKKKLFVSALTFIVFALCAMCLFACSTKGDEHSHSWGKWVTDDGITHTRTCDCGQSETKNHNWDNGLITKESTCKESGLKTYTCLDCGQTRTESIEKTTSHNWGLWLKNDNLSHGRTCSVCNKTETTNHSWDNGTVTKSPTCKDTGIKTYTCLDCGATKTETLEKNNLHSYQKWVTDGATTHTHICSVCNKSETANHSWNNGTVTKSPNCKETGVKTFTCSDCGATKTETLEKTSIHTWSKWTSDNTETHSRTCTVCSETETENHNIANETCTVCGFSYLPATITSVDNATMDYANSSIDMFVDKNTSTINLSNMVKVSPNSSWKLYGADSALIATKFTNLQNGDNDYLIVVSSADGLYDNTYTLKIYKSFEISVNYYDIYNNVIKTITTDTGYKYTVEYTPNIVGYTFKYWKLDGKQTTEFTPYDNVNLYAVCTVNTYTLSLNADSGEVAETSKQVTFDSNYTLPIPTKTGYTFTGWYYGENKITGIDGTSLKVSKFSVNSEIIAKWKVNSYHLTTKYDDYLHGSVTGSGDYDYASSVTVEATTKAGYTFIGWYNGETLLDGNLTYTFTMPAENVTYTAKWCKVSVESDNTDYGTVTPLTETYEVGEKVNIVATTEKGCVFIGWFNGETKISTDLTCVVDMPSTDTVYTAKWCKVTIENDSSSGKTNDLNSTYVIGEEVLLTAETYLGYDWLGWYCGDELLSTEQNYTTIMPLEDTVYTAKRTVKKEMQIFGFSSTLTSCTIMSLKDKTETKITIPDYVTHIDYSAFKDCSGIIQTENGVEYVDNWAIRYDFSSRIPDIILKSNTKGIANYAFYNNYGNYSLKSITIPDSVTSIGSYAFSGCSELTSVTIPDSVTSIGDYAFAYCNGLTSITIPDSVTSIGDYAFYSCNSLTSTFFVGDINKWVEISGLGALMNSSRTLYINGEVPTTIELTTATKITNYAFADCKGLTTITIPNSVTSIGSSAFWGCSGLTSVTIPDSVTSIGSSAFSGCSGLTSVTIPDSVTSIGSSAFWGCSGLTSITIPDSVTSIGSSAFEYCYRLVEIYNKSSLTITVGSTDNGYVGYYAKNIYATADGSKLTTNENGFVMYDGNTVVNYVGTATEITIPNTVTTINDYAFYDCSNLTSVTIPDSVTSIGSSAFSGCSSLTSITIPDSVTSIGYSAFWYCKSLTTITIPDSVTSIGDFAFSGCSELTSVTIPDSVTSIGSSAFRGCSGLTSITIPDSVTSIGSSAFEYCSGLTSVTIPDSVTSIGSYAFRGCSELTSVTIPNSVTGIGSYAFAYCNNNLVINCEAVSEPTLWASYWNRKSYDTYDYYIVVWDYKNKG